MQTVIESKRGRNVSSIFSKRSAIIIISLQSLLMIKKNNNTKTNRLKSLAQGNRVDLWCN